MIPARQRLLGGWLLASGLLLFGGLLLAAWLDTQLPVRGWRRAGLWLACLSGAAVMLALGWPLERRLFAPLRHLQVQLARLAANPDAREDFPPEGWLQVLRPDLDQVRQGWRRDRDALRTAREQGAADAARIRLELEAVLQVLRAPLLLVDRHRRLLLFNPAAENLFAGASALGLGRRLDELLPIPSLADALEHLPGDGQARQLLLPYAGRWLRCDLRRVVASQGEVLLTLEDTTAQLAADQQWREPLAELLPSLRGHSGNLVSAGEVLSSGDASPALRQRLEAAVQQESEALAGLVDRLARLLEHAQQDPGRLDDTWSNDLWSALSEQLASAGLEITPVGIPAWFKADGPALLQLLATLVRQLHAATGQRCFDAEVQVGNRRVYLDLIWQGEPLAEGRLERWRELRVADTLIAPRLADILQRHDSDWWSLPDDKPGQARLRLPLGAVERVGEPQLERQARPVFHDFSIAELPAPSAELGERALRDLEFVVFDTETTGLKLRHGDRVISIGACRIVNGRLLAREQFDQRVNPQRPIPAESTRIHGLSDADVAEAPPITVVLPRFREFVGHGVLVAHNAAFDLLAVSQQAEEAGVEFSMPVLDTLFLSRALDPTLELHGLDALAERFRIGFEPGTRHTALGDARVTAELLLTLLPRLEARGIRTLAQALEFQASAALDTLQ